MSFSFRYIVKKTQTLLVMCLPGNFFFSSKHLMEKGKKKPVIHMYLWSIITLYVTMGVKIIIMRATFIEVLGTGSMLIALYNLSQSIHQLSWESKVFIPISQMRNLGLGEAKPLAQGHTLVTSRARINVCNKMGCFSCTG